MEFSLESFARLLSCRVKAKFFINALSFVDLLAAYPYLNLYGLDVNNIRTITVLKIQRLLRVCRLFWLSRHFHRLKIIEPIAADSLRELKLFLT